MSLEDRLRRQSVPPLAEILAGLFEDEATGTLAVSSDQIERRVIIEDGAVLGVRSSLEGEMLGTWLVTQSKISEGERALALLSQGGGSQPIGRLLSAQGRIDEGSLEAEIRRLWLTIVARAAAESAPQWVFSEDDLGDAGAGPAIVKPLEVLLVAARACPDSAAKRRAMGEPEQNVWPALGLDSLLREVDLTPTEAFLLSRLRGTDTVGNLISQSSLAEDVAVSTLYSLCLAGVVSTGPTPHPVHVEDGRRHLGSGDDDANLVDEGALDDGHRAERNRIRDRAERAARVDHYAALGIGRGATVEEIDLSWSLIERTFSRSRTSEPHLTDFGDHLDAIVERARDAHTVLAKPSTKKRYDRILDDIESKDLDLGRRAAQPETNPGARRAIVEANFERAEQLLALGELYGAIQLLENACALEPRPEQLVKLARLLLRNPSWTSRALRHLQHATEVDPKAVEAWIELAEFWRRKNDPNRQRRALQRVLAIEPDHKRAKAMLHNVGERQTGIAAKPDKKSSGSFFDIFRPEGLMPILIDGNNLMHRLDGGQRSRVEVRRLTLDRARRERMQVTLVFDGPPPVGTPEREVLGSVTVLYSGSTSADDRIVAILDRGGRGWVVVTDDQGLATRARHAGAEVRAVAQWTTPARRPGAGARRAPAEPRLSSHDVADWEAFFAAGDRRHDD